MQRVLIVDDSKTAQLRLKKMMTRYDLTVDVAFSAEEALGYLSYRMPAVIFMDHHMEGMDGFEALKIIKANPTTATVPVIMYTAQKGDVYVGQARALGALDILSKEVIKPSNLERVLASLKIYPIAHHEAVAIPVAAGAGVVTPLQPPGGVEENSDNEKPPHHPAASSATTDFEEMQLQVARLFELHIADVRQQISEHSRYVVRRLSNEIEKAAEKEPKIGDVPLSVINEEISADSRRANRLSSSLLIFILVAVGLLSFQLYETRTALNTLSDDYNLLVEGNRQSQALVSSMAEVVAQSNKELSKTSLNSGITAAISWALDTNLQFEFNQAPLNEELMMQISTLVYRLASVGFEGIVELNIHRGNFCLQQASNGEYQLASANTPADQCLLLADTTPDFPVSQYLSLPYMNFQDNAVPIKQGQIDLNVVSTGIGEPRVPYPENPHTVSAAEWNAIAAKNNRVTVDLSAL
ncbi:response regulator [Teredinibacter turnerae]|uniref:response regulator n=1 Tax=Teredinibacter turnerae TaxID=2426 RepID=UPI000363B54D|nr:response regulator [Teredinibacter turnerae]